MFLIYLFILLIKIFKFDILFVHSTNSSKVILLSNLRNFLNVLGFTPIIHLKVSEKYSKELKRLEMFEAIAIIIRTMPIRVKLLPNYKIDWGYIDKEIPIKERKLEEIKIYSR